ncbi:allophanate hydrolase subunit 1 [Rhodococcus sp. NPDC003318]|uniref:5-oxoprolinase subunit B family protein n=1 Tax=Rhodococcus sp. NPDC003318 TaxID=3364503 RepID=UPI0036957A9A
MKVLPCGDRAFLIELANVDEVLRYHASLQAADIDGITDLVPAARTIFVQIDPDRADLRQVVGAVQVMDLAPVPTPEETQVVDIPTRYDGPDLSGLSDLLGLTPNDLVRRHTSQLWTVAFTGFAPGFAYLVGADAPFDVPRLEVPRLEVPAGAVALAGPFTGIYPRSSPGGWQVIGTTEVRMWDLERTPPALLSAGDHVRFVEVS